jgi:hypothetical protein
MLQQSPTFPIIYNGAIGNVLIWTSTLDCSAKYQVFIIITKLIYLFIYKVHQQHIHLLL